MGIKKAGNNSQLSAGSYGDSKKHLGERGFGKVSVQEPHRHSQSEIRKGYGYLAFR